MVGIEKDGGDVLVDEKCSLPSSKLSSWISDEEDESFISANSYDSVHSRTVEEETVIEKKPAKEDNLLTSFRDLQVSSATITHAIEEKDDESILSVHSKDPATHPHQLPQQKKLT